MPDQPGKTTKKKARPVNLDTLGLEMGNKPPQALEVEEAVLGAMLIEPSSVDTALEELTVSCFYDPRHRMIFEAMTSLVNEHVSVDIVTVSAKLREKGNLEAVGGPVALAGLSEKVGAAAHIEYYVRILKQKNIQRELITASYEILRDAYDDSVKVGDLIDDSQSRIYNAIQSSVKTDIQEIGSVINEAMKEVEKNQKASGGLSGVPSGFPSLDRVTRGWQKSDLIILAARPSVGKTAFALNLARNAAVDYKMPVAVFSLEMSALQLVMRLMTTESGLPADKLKGGAKLDPWDWQQLETRLANLSKAPLYIDDTPSIPLMEFRTKIKRLVKAKGVRLVIVDYLQLMRSAPDHRAGARIDAGVRKFFQKIIRFLVVVLADFMRMYHDQDCLTCHLCFPYRVNGPFYVDRIRSGASSLCSVLADFKHFPAKFHDTLGKRSDKSLLPVQIPQSVDSGHLCNLREILRMFFRNGIFFRKAQRI